MLLVAPRERTAMLQRLAELSEKRLSDPTRAFSWWSLALVEDPSSEYAAAELERLAGDIGAWEETAMAYEQALERHGATLERQSKRDVLMRRAAVLEFRVGDIGRAV